MTSRLVLEPLQPAHADVLFEGLKDPRLYAYHACQPRSLEGLRKRFTRLAAGPWPDAGQVWFNWAIRLHDGTYVGWIQATVEGPSAILGYDIFADHWRKGYGSEACSAVIDTLARDHGAVNFKAIVDSENAASKGLLESLGFRLAWTGPSEDMPGRTDHRYERTIAN